MKYIKRFVAGMSIPSFLLPFLLSLAWLGGRAGLLTLPFLHFIPLLWGVWNIFYFTFLDSALPGNRPFKLLLTGALLGLLIALYGVFVLQLPLLMGITSFMRYFPLLLAPVIYAVLWLYGVDWLNRLLGVEREGWF